MSTFSEYRRLPSGLSLDHHVISHGIEVEEVYNLTNGQRSVRITKEEYDALYPLSWMEESE